MSWKTPLGYYERAIEELRRAREEFQGELQNLKEMKASVIELPKEIQALKVELELSQKEIQALKAELQTTKEHLAITNKTAIEAQTELQNKANITSELIQIKEQLSQLQSQLQEVQEQNSNSQNDSQPEIREHLTTLRLRKKGRGQRAEGRRRRK